MQTQALEKKKKSTPRSALSLREQEIFSMLVKGCSLKEISYELKVRYDTIYFHQKNIFNKLCVNNYREFLIKYLQNQPNPVPDETDESVKETSAGTSAVFTQVLPFKDELGSVINVIVNNLKIKRQCFTCYIMTGTHSYHNSVYSGFSAIPDSITFKKMKTASSFSFKVLGDGNDYQVSLSTSDTRTISENNHFRKVFTANKGKTSIITVKINELAQSELWGKPVPFIQNNVEYFIIQPIGNCEFNLKIWDIKFY